MIPAVCAELQRLPRNPFFAARPRRFQRPASSQDWPTRKRSFPTEPRLLLEARIGSFRRRSGPRRGSRKEISPEKSRSAGGSGEINGPRQNKATPAIRVWACAAIVVARRGFVNLNVLSCSNRHFYC